VKQKETVRPSATTLRHEPQVRTGGGWMIEEWGEIPDVPGDFFKEALIKTLCSDNFWDW